MVHLGHIGGGSRTPRVQVGGVRKVTQSADFMDEILSSTTSKSTKEESEAVSSSGGCCPGDMSDFATPSYAQRAGSILAIPSKAPRPRGLFRQTSALMRQSSLKSKKDAPLEHPTHFATRANNTIIHRSKWSRITYTIVLLNMTLWIPPWLKLLMIRRNEKHQDVKVNLYNASIGMNLYVSTFDEADSLGACKVCDRRDDRNQENFQPGITYSISASVRDFIHEEHIQTDTRISLFGSFDWDTWYILSEPGYFTGLPHGDSEVEVCLDRAMEDDEYDRFDKDDDDESAEQTASWLQKTATVTTRDQYQISDTGETEDGAVWTDNQYQETVQTWTTLAPTVEAEQLTDAPTPIPKHHRSRCCLGLPGFVYLVACATPYSSVHYADFYTKIEGPGFEDRCISLAGRCGASCGVDADKPVDNTCNSDGTIPLEKLLDKRVFEGSGNKRKNRHYDEKDRFESIRNQLYQTLFVIFVTMTTTGTWVSFLAGNGHTASAPKPSMTEVEEYMAAGSTSSKKKKPLCLVVFSISASEPRMMILRNFCGKLMSWLNQRKFTLMQRNAANSIFTGADDTMSASTLFDDDDEDEYERHLSSNTADHAELIDIFQDEGHRVGAYALWDAWIDLVHDADLRFIECMASKMTNMTADDDRLLSKAEDDGMLLDDELRNYAKTSQHIGVSQESIDKLELAYACFDLLNALAHHAFWRSDRNVNVTGFRDLASDPEAAAVLCQWATNFKKAPKGTSPFAPSVTPTQSAGIEPRTWNAYWELYSEMGRIEWMKRFDCTKFRLARLHYYRDREESVFRDLVMCYSARANPEDLKIQLAPTVNLRGITKGVFVRLRECSTDGIKDLFSSYSMRYVCRSEARRCHARVLGTCRRKGRTYVKVKECTPELLQILPMQWLACEGRIPEDFANDDEDENDDDDDDAFQSSTSLLSSSDGEEAVIPMELVIPLRQSRGKSGGMNHAMEVLNHYIRHHSSTFSLLQKKYKQANPPSYHREHRVDAHMLFAIFDCRHMATQGFWDAVIPYFYGYKHSRNPWARDLKIDSSVAFVQLPQTFTSLNIESDIFDMRNEYLFRLANNIRNGVGAITSCGTNAVWNYDICWQESPLEHRFNEDTMIEDTASSHDVIIEGRTGIYHFERLVLGARKGSGDYLAAVFRWSRGAVQLFWTTFWFPRYHYVWPWIVLLVHIVPIIGTTIYLQMARLDECHHTKITKRVGLYPCHWGPAAGLMFDPIFQIYFIVMVTLATVSYHWCRVGAYLVMFENVTYFFTSTSAFFWIIVPQFMCIAKRGLPTVLDTQLICLGGLWVQLHMGLLLQHVKSWSPLEDGTKPTNQSLLRAQQMFIINAPLHVLAMMFGFRDGIAICFFNLDASRWSSFDNKMAMTSVKLWMITLIAGLVTSIGFGIHRLVVFDDTEQERGERVLGLSLCLIILFLVETPVRAMFFFDSVLKEKAKPGPIARVTRAIFGRATVPRPDIVYGLLWFLLFLYSLQQDELAESDGVLNVKSRCQNDNSLPGCRDTELYKKVTMNIDKIPIN